MWNLHGFGQLAFNVLATSMTNTSRLSGYWVDFWVYVYKYSSMKYENTLLLHRDIL